MTDQTTAETIAEYERNKAKEKAEKTAMTTLLNDPKVEFIREKKESLLKEIDQQERNKEQRKKEINVLKYPRDLGEVEYKQNWIKFQFYEHRSDQKRKDDFKIKDIVYPTVILPLSARMMYSSISAHYGVIDQGQLNNILYENAREFGATSTGIQQTISHAVSEGNFTDAAESYLLTNLLQSEIKGVKAAYHAYGVALNNNFTVRYQDRDPMYRNFQPAWTFVPKNEEDARTLNDVIRVFQRNALPRELNAVNAANQMEDGRPSTVRYNNHFRYPRKMQIKIFVGGEEFKKVGFLPMVINTVEVSHNDKLGGSGAETVPLHKTRNNKFYHPETTLRLSLEETEIFTRGKVQEIGFTKLGEGFVKAMEKVMKSTPIIHPQNLPAGYNQALSESVLEAMEEINKGQ